MSKNKRTIKIPTAQRLQNAALYYLSRYAASEESLRRVLHNRIRRAARAHPDFAADHGKHNELRAAIETIIASHKKSGAVNDAAVAEMKVRNLRRAGRSQNFIRQKLSGRGLSKPTIENALHNHDAEEAGDDGADAELKAAAIYIRRKRLGSHRPPLRQKDGDRQRDFANLARAGFSAAVIRTILASTPDDEPEMGD